MSQTPPPARRSLGGLPPRATRSSTAAVARLIRSNRDDDATDSAQATSAGTAARAASTDAVPPPHTDDRTPAVAESQSPAVQLGTGGVPKYLQLVRREARMHVGQVSALSDLTRALNEARRAGHRSGVGERITDNTLVRIAVDLLLQDPQRLRGTTEDELRASVGLAPLPPHGPTSG